MGERELIFLPVFVAQVAPITGGMPPKEIAGLLAGFLERGERTGCGNDLTFRFARTEAGEAFIATVNRCDSFFHL